MKTLKQARAEFDRALFWFYIALGVNVVLFVLRIILKVTR